MSKEKPHYDDEFRASAVAALEGAGYPEQEGSLSRTAQHLGIHRMTLLRWATEKNNPPPRKLVTEKKAELADLLDAEIRAALTQMGVKRVNASYRDLATSVAIFVDKKQLLMGKPTWIVEIADLLQRGKVTLEEVEEELGQDLATELFESIGLSATTSRETKA